MVGSYASLPICLSVPLSGFVRPMLRTTSWVQDYVVHHQPVLCTTDHGAQGGPMSVRIAKKNFIDVSTVLNLVNQASNRSDVLHMCKSKGGLCVNIKLHLLFNLQDERLFIVNMCCRLPVV